MMAGTQPYLLTASGQRYRLTGPELDAPRIGDIAHHLAQINRFTGAASRPYSVAEHSLLCEHIAASEGAGPLARLCALMHDAHEYVTADFASPAKLALLWWDGQQRQGAGTSDYDYFEAIHAAHVRESFGLSDVFIAHRQAIKRWDLIALATERRDLMPADDGEGWEILRGVEPLFNPGDLNHPGFVQNTWQTYRDIFLQKFVDLRLMIDPKSKPL